MFESRPDKLMIVILFFFKNIVDFLEDSGFSNNDKNRVCLVLKAILIEQKRDYSDTIKNREKSIIHRIINKINKSRILLQRCLKMLGLKDQRSSTFLKSLTDPDMMK